MIHTLAFQFEAEKSFLILDQSLLPKQKQFIKIEHPQDIIDAIKKLKVRGANLIGITAGLALAQYALKHPKAKDFHVLAKKLCEARPTAIHLSQVVNQILKQSTPQKKLAQAIAYYKKDQKDCEQMALNARSLINQGDGILTYCNTGTLATSGKGTALGVIRQAFYDKKNPHVFVCETRPLNQGSRLTFWELNEEKIPCTLICDNMLAHLICQKKVQMAFVGADRISANGDTANKIGTYNLAVICHHFKLPFYVVAATSTIDSTIAKGENIPIEQRCPKEVSPYWAGVQASIDNPAFDITPKKLITAIITEKEISY